MMHECKICERGYCIDCTQLHWCELVAKIIVLIATKMNVTNAMESSARFVLLSTRTSAINKCEACDKVFCLECHADGFWMLDVLAINAMTNAAMIVDCRNSDWDNRDARNALKELSIYSRVRVSDCMKNWKS